MYVLQYALSFRGCYVFMSALRAEGDPPSPYSPLHWKSNRLLFTICLYVCMRVCGGCMVHGKYIKLVSNPGMKVKFSCSREIYYSNICLWWHMFECFSEVSYRLVKLRYSDFFQKIYQTGFKPRHESEIWFQIQAWK